MKTKAVFIALSALAYSASGAMVVHDPVQTAQQAVHETVNYVQWLHQQVNTLNTYTNQVTQLARMGNPANLMDNIPGIQAVRSIAQTGRELMGDYYMIRGLTNPQQYQYTLSSMLSQYQNPNWTGMVSSGYGVRTNPYQQGYSYQTSQWQVLEQASKTLQKIEEKRQDLQRQQAELNAAANASTTHSEVEKYHAALDAVNGALQSLEATEAQYRAKVELLQRQMQLGERVYNQSNTERNMGYYQQSVENSMLPSTGYHAINGGVGTGSLFGSVDNPIFGGSGDPGLTSGSWDQGAWGADLSNPNTVGVALPNTVLRTFFGNPDHANGASVRVTDTRTGQSATFPIIDRGPGSSSSHAIDLTQAAADQIGMRSGDQMVYQVGSMGVN